MLLIVIFCMIVVSDCIVYAAENVQKIKASETILGEEYDETVSEENSEAGSTERVAYRS